MGFETQLRPVEGTAVASSATGMKILTEMMRSCLNRLLLLALHRSLQCVISTRRWLVVEV